MVLDWVELPEELHRFRAASGELVFIGHGSPEGLFSWEGGYLAEDCPPAGLLVCCHPAQVAARYPAWKVALSDLEGTVEVSYLRGEGSALLEIRAT